MFEDEANAAPCPPRRSCNSRTLAHDGPPAPTLAGKNVHPNAQRLAFTIERLLARDPPELGL
jgi:hypothetical protein